MTTPLRTCSRAQTRVRSQALRWREWKLHGLRRPEGPWALYNLTADPGEARDVAAERPAVVERLAAVANASHDEDPNWPSGAACHPSDTYARSVSFALAFS